MLSNGERVLVRGFAFVCLVVPIALTGCGSLSLSANISVHHYLVLSLCCSILASIPGILYCSAYICVSRITSKDRIEHQQHNKDNEGGIRHRHYLSWKRDRTISIVWGSIRHGFVIIWDVLLRIV